MRGEVRFEGRWEEAARSGQQLGRELRSLLLTGGSKTSGAQVPTEAAKRRDLMRIYASRCVSA